MDALTQSLDVPSILDGLNKAVYSDIINVVQSFVEEKSKFLFISNHCAFKLSWLVLKH